MSSNRKIKDEIITLLIDHSRIIYSVISDMGVYYTGWSEGYESNKKSLIKKKNKMQLDEEEADEIKIKIIKDYAEIGSQLGNFVALILRMDNLINYPLEFVDMLPNINLNDINSKEIHERYEKLLNIIMNMANVLKTTIKNLRDNQEKVFKNTTEIHEIENEIDRNYRQFLEFLYSNTSLDIRMTLRIRDSIVLLENLADRIHDIGDQIRVLIYS
jgi:uncharacterized protein Yka (UPF0111/DUF47 family)